MPKYRQSSPNTVFPRKSPVPRKALRETLLRYIPDMFSETFFRSLCSNKLLKTIRKTMLCSCFRQMLQIFSHIRKRFQTGGKHPGKLLIRRRLIRHHDHPTSGTVRRQDPMGRILHRHTVLRLQSKTFACIEIDIRRRLTLFYLCSRDNFTEIRRQTSLLQIPIRPLPVRGRHHRRQAYRQQKHRRGAARREPRERPGLRRLPHRLGRLSTLNPQQRPHSRRVEGETHVRIA